MSCKEIENSVSLATELLMEVKKQTRRWFIAFIICLILLFGSNMVWLYAWNQYEFTSCEINSEDGGNANYIGNDGDIMNGTYQSENDEKKGR